MNYSKIYNQLIHRGKSRNLECYTELHHIVPRCIGGSDNPENLVPLTPEEHYVAHQLLVKIYPNEPKMIFAAHKMVQGRPGNKLYGWLRRKHAIAMSEAYKVKKKPALGRMWITNGINNRLIPKFENIPDGYHPGRIMPESMKIKISKLYKGREKSEEHLKKIRESLNTPECKAKLSSRNKGRKFSKEHREKLSQVQIGRPRSKDSIEKSSEKHKKNYVITDPNGIKYFVKGLDQLRKFCVEHSLKFNSLVYILRGKSKNRNNFNGWVPKIL